MPKKKKPSASPSKQVHQPHDKLTKKLLSNLTTARDILSQFLPAEVLSVTDLSQLSVESGSFIDDKHRAFAVDMLYKTKMNEEDAWIYFYIEQARKPEYWQPFTLLRYMVLAMDHVRRQHKKRRFLPLVYPLLIYNGDRQYPYSMNLIDLIEPKKSKEIFSTLFTKPFPLLDLSQIQDEELKERMQHRINGLALLMALKHTFDRNITQFCTSTFIVIWKQLDQNDDRDELVDIIFYYLNEAPHIEKKALFSLIHNELSKETEGEFMTVAQSLRAEGRKEGMREGILKGVQQGIQKGFEVTTRALKMLLDGKDIATIAKLTRLSIAEIKQLKASIMH